MVNFNPLPAEIGWRVWGTPANQRGSRVGFVTAATSLNANPTLHDVWPSPGLTHYIYIFGGSCPWRNFARCKIHFASKFCACTALWQRVTAKLCGVEPLKRRRHLHSAGRPSRWASAYILVFLLLLPTLPLCGE